jgi:hypothetical protein
LNETSVALAASVEAHTQVWIMDLVEKPSLHTLACGGLGDSREIGATAGALQLVPLYIKFYGTL